MKLKEALTKLKEGDEVEVAQTETIYTINKLKGIVGEIHSDKFYLWQDERDEVPEKKPVSRGKNTLGLFIKTTRKLL